LKQMKIIHGNGFTQTELMEHKSSIYRNVLESAAALIEATTKFELTYTDPRSPEMVNLITARKTMLDQTVPFTQEFANAIQIVWNDPASKAAMERTSEFYIMDSAPLYSTTATLLVFTHI
jgi:guanine nucleotide-binding protein G(i) subunit alpha